MDVGLGQGGEASPVALYSGKISEGLQSLRHAV